MEKEEENRFLLLLQPNRDLAANWAVDVGRELEIYLEGLALSSRPHHEGCLDASFNFAQAALLIQGSIQIYSRKVEYLYALVLQALDFIAHKKEAHQSNSSIQDNGKDADIVEDLEEEFLNLDDFPEEANIDLVEADCGSSCISSAVKRPACLLIVEGENLDLSGDIGELASYQISTSSLHRDFLLLDPCDAKYVDEYWKDNENLKTRRNTPSNPRNSVSGKTPKSVTLTPGRKHTPHHDTGVLGSSQRHQSITKSPRLNMGSFGNDMDDWHDDNGGDACEYEVDGSKDGAEAMFQQKTDNKSVHNQTEVQEDDFLDPWAPLNPHEPGTLPVVPYRKGRPKKRRAKPKWETVSEPNDTRMGKVWQALECLEREIWRSKQLEEPPPYEKLRSSFISKGSPLAGNGSNSDKSDRISDSEDSDDGGLAGDDAPDHCYEPDFVDDPISSQELSQQHNYNIDQVMLNIPETGISEETCLEALCQAQLDAILKKQSQAERRSEMANRVTSWKQKIERNLAKQDSQPPFDIHVYGERVLDKLLSCQGTSTDSSGVEASFTHIVQGLEKHEVARTFSALLQLVNNGNVSLETHNGMSSFECFTAERPFSVKLLNYRKRHEEMLHYRAPSSKDAFKGSSKKKGKADTLVLESNVFDEVRGENQYENSFQGVRSSSGKKGKLAIASDNQRPPDVPKLDKCLTSPRSTTVDGKSQKQKQKQKPKEKQTRKQSQRQSLTPIQVGLVS